MLHFIQKLNQVEIPFCLFFNRINHVSLVSRFFAGISRLGDGVLWYTIILSLPFIYGLDALKVSIHMASAGMVCLLIYKKMKLSTSRIRPYRYDSSIFKNVAALDKFSFPSGHTLHAVCFSTVLLAYYPEWAFFVIPFTALVMLSRLVLGLHYPSDVIIGALIGGGIAKLSQPLFALLPYFQPA